MHLILLDRWNDLDTPLHRLDPRTKILGIGAIVVFLATSSAGLTLKIPAIAAALLALLALSRVPLGYCLKRAALVLPFSVVAVAAAFIPHSASAGWLSRMDAGAIVAKSYLAALAMLVLAVTTRLPDLLKGMELMRVPAAFLMVVQFLYRYLFVISEETQHMGYARQSRDAGRGGTRLFRRAAGPTIAVLFARSHDRAERIHRAMLARGFNGVLPVERALRWGRSDALFVAFVLCYLAALQSASVYLL